MPLPISSISSVASAGFSSATGAAKSSAGFQELLEGAINRVEDLRKTADQSVDRVLSGENEELHNTVLATQRAELAFELFSQVRNKVVSAYQEVMRMQL
jgi:flagellar hook-basal body complex protein FliE